MPTYDLTVLNYADLEFTRAELVTRIRSIDTSSVAEILVNLRDGRPVVTVSTDDPPPVADGYADPLAVLISTARDLEQLGARLQTHCRTSPEDERVAIDTYALRDIMLRSWDEPASTEPGPAMRTRTTDSVPTEHRRPIKPSLGLALMMLAAEALLSIVSAALEGSQYVSVLAVVTAFVLAFYAFRNAVSEINGARVNEVAVPVWQSYTGLAIVMGRIVAAVVQVW